MSLTQGIQNFKPEGSTIFEEDQMCFSYALSFVSNKLDITYGISEAK